MLHGRERSRETAVHHTIKGKTEAQLHPSQIFPSAPEKGHVRTLQVRHAYALLCSFSQISHWLVGGEEGHYRQTSQLRLCCIFKCKKTKQKKNKCVNGEFCLPIHSQLTIAVFNIKIAWPQKHPHWNNLTPKYPNTEVSVQ